MKLAIFAAVAATVVVPASSIMADTPITVLSQSKTQIWVERVSHKLDRALDRSLSPFGGDNYALDGWVTISFECGADGMPTALRVSRSSGVRQLDRVALRSVRLLGSLHPLPTSIGSGQKFRANIIVAQDAYALRKHASQLRTEEARRTAQSGSSNELAIGSVRQPTV